METNNDTNIIGKNIRLLRQKENWSQGEAAKKMKISIPAFSKIETGITDCNFTRLLQIAELFSVHVMNIVLPPGEFSKIDRTEEVNNLQELLRIKEREIIKLQSRTIELYEEIMEKQ